MNRRDFLKAAFGLLVVSYLPAAESAGEWIWCREFISRHDIEARFESIDAARRASDYFIAVMHPGCQEGLMRVLTPQERWRLAYRTARMELKKMATDFAESGEIGSCEGFRFVESRA